MMASPDTPITASEALALAAFEYFRERSERRTKRLLVHRYPRQWLERACETFLDLARNNGSAPTVEAKPVSVGLVQPRDEVDRLKEYRGWTYGCSPDWPVRARDEGGLLLILCPPEWYESLHESIRSNSFLSFDEGGRPGAPRQLLTRMIDTAGLGEGDRKLVWEVARLLLEEGERQRHDRGIVETLEAVGRYLGGDAVPTASTLRALGLVPDDRLTPDLSAQDIRKRVRDNLKYQETLSAEMARSPAKYFAESFPKEADQTTAEELRAHVARFDYDLRTDDPSWRITWPEGLTLDRVRRRDGPDPRSRARATLRRLEPSDWGDRFEGVPVVHESKVELTWEAVGPDEARDQDVSAFVDGIEVRDAVVRLDDQRLEIPSVSPGRHTLELRAVDPNGLEILGHTRCEVFVTRDGIMPFAVRNQSGNGERFDVRPARTFQLLWHHPDDPSIARWALRGLGESGSEVAYPPLASSDRTFSVEGGVVEPTDFYLAAIGQDGQEIGGAVLKVIPLEEGGERASSAGSVGQALVDAARRLREERNGTWAELRQRSTRVVIEEPSATQYTIRLYDGEEVVWERAYRIRGSLFLDGLEQKFLDDPERPWLLVAPARAGAATIEAWPVAQSEQEELADWQRTLATDVSEFAEFVDQRCRLFARLRALVPERGAVIGGFPLVEVADEIRSYAASYERVLRAVVADENEFRAHHVLLALVDTVALIGTTLHPPFAVTGPHADIRAVLVGPTHPLRLLWLLQFESAIRGAIESGDGGDFNPDSFESISGINYPPYLIDFERRFYRNVGMSLNYSWGLYLPESDVESDSSLSPILQRELSLRPTGENVAVSSDQISNALSYYHEAHPFRDALRFHYIGAGSGEKIVEALHRLLDEQRRRTKDVVEVTGERLRFHVNLLDVYDDEAPSGTGRAFEEYAERADPDAELLGRVLFSVQSVERRQFERPEVRLPAVDRNHIVFGSEVFKARGGARSVQGRAYPLSAWGLRNLPMKFMEGGDEPRLFVSSLVPPPSETVATAAIERNVDLLHRLLSLYQIMSSVSDQIGAYHSDVARMQVIEIDRATMGAIERMHHIAEWVYIVDAHIDVELFDRPGQEGRYILDYRPTIGATGRKDSRHNYVITTADDAQIVAVVERFLQSKYAGVFPATTPNVVREAARRLLQTLNRVSGRSLLHVLGRPAAVKGVVGVALARTLYQRLGLLDPLQSGPDIRSIRLLVPIDDYFDVWRSDEKALLRLRGGPDGRRADLLDVEIALAGGGATIDVRILEVKNLYADYSDVGLAEPAEQVRATYRTLETILFGPEARGRRDAPIKSAEFVQVLDFHLRRRLMQGLGDAAGATASARSFRSSLHEALASGRVTVRIGTPPGVAGENRSAGTVLHFSSDPDSPAFAIDDPDAYLEEGEDPFVRYARLGRDDVTALLLGSGTLPEDELRMVLNGAIARRYPNKPIDTRASADDPGRAAAAQLKPQEPDPGIAESAATPHEEAALSVLSEQSERFERASNAFEGFVGNNDAKELLLPILVQGLSETPSRLPTSLIFVGPPSTGKTELAKRIARTLDLPFLHTSASAISNIDDLLASMKRQVESERARLRRVDMQGGRPVFRFPPMCVFVDEAHELRNPVQNALLTLLEPNDRRGGGPNTPYIADVSDVTFIFATTDFGSLDRALRTRLERIELAPYTVEQVASIVEGAYPGWPADVYPRLAVVGRKSPRIALERARNLARRLNTYANESPGEALDRLFQLWGSDERGISDQDRNLLRLLAQERQPRGVSYLASRLQTSDDDITEVIEPYLSELGFIARQPNGRIITDAGRRYLRGTVDQA